MCPGTFSLRQLERVDTFFANTEFVKKSPKYMWGVYEIKERNIAFEKWVSSNASLQSSFLRLGRILNDSTL